MKTILIIIGVVLLILLVLYLIFGRDKKTGRRSETPCRPVCSG